MALEWAADEAHLRGAVLRIGHSWSMQAYRLPEAYKRDIADDALRAAWDILETQPRTCASATPGSRWSRS